MRHLTRYFLCDQSLVGFSGHCFAYYAPVARILRARGRAVTIIGNVQRDGEVAAMGVIGGFSYSCDQRDVGQGGATLAADQAAHVIRDAHETAMARDLARLDGRFGFDAADRIVINSIRHWAIRGVLRWLEARPDALRPRIILLLHFTAQPEQFQPDASERHYRDAFQAIEASPCRGLFRLYADATTLIDEYRTLTALDVGLAPFPHSQFATRHHHRDPSAPIRIGYVGEARYHKGFQFLPFIIEHLDRTELRGRVEFHLHSFIHDKQADFHLKAMAHLRARPDVVLYPDALDPERYAEFIARCDVILLPYLLMYYHSQTSGIYADALGLATPVVVPDGTWMAKELRRLGGGGVLAAAGDHVSFATATHRVCVDIERHREDARVARETWLSFNTPEKLADLFEADPFAIGIRPD